MDYSKIYDQLIDKRKSDRILEGYYETHHIIPRSMGGTDAPDNLVRLTAREHFIAHRILARIYGGKMAVAFFMMCQPRCKSGRGVRVTSRAYDDARRRISRYYSVALRGRNNPNFGNNKVSGDKNGRYNKTEYVWQNKHTGKLLVSTCYDAYRKHGMSKAGVISCISGSRSGVRDWLFIGEKGKCEPYKPVHFKVCKMCGIEKWDKGFPKDNKSKDGFKSLCKDCYRKTGGGRRREPKGGE